METSSDSDSYSGRRWRGRRRSGRNRRASSGSGTDIRALDISEKINTLANTLQDTSRNLTKVDRMLGQYREQTDDQAEAMAVLRESLEDSINQLQSRKLGKANGACSVSGSTLQTSDLDACSESELRRFYPASPLKDMKDGRRRRSRSANVRFKDSGMAVEDIHVLHQSLRDLHSDQKRLSDELDREILRRNRADIDTRRAMESLSEHMTAAQRQDSVPSRVERRLQELERGLCGEQGKGDRERKPEQRAASADELQEPLGRRPLQTLELEDVMVARLQKAEREKFKMEQELEKVTKMLHQSEQTRESLSQQVTDMQSELLKKGTERTAQDRSRLATPQFNAPLHINHTCQELLQDRLDLEKELEELRAQVRKVAVLGEVEELKRALDAKEKERLQLSLQVKDLSSDFARQEEQQLRMLDQLREIQNRGQADKRQMESLLQETTKSRDELKNRAQEAVQQWRAKCKRLQKKVEEAVEEKERSHAQLKSLSQQSESACRELTEVLGRMAQREEELHRKDVELSETRQQLLSLEQEVREMKESSSSLERESQRHATIQATLREENQKLEERANTQARRLQKEQDAKTELEATLRQLTATNTELSQRLGEEESGRKELKRCNTELGAKLTALQVERAALSQQLQLEREVHQKELNNMKVTIEDNMVKKDCQVYEMLKLCRQERDEIKEQLREAKTNAHTDREMCEALQLKLDRIKEECDKLVAELSTKEEAHSALQRKCQLLKQQLENRVVSGKQRQASESELERLEKKILQIETDQETILMSLGEELDGACRILAKNGEDKLQAIYQKPGLVKDPHRWLAETKTKLRWLCEEVREQDTKSQRLRKQHQQTKDQLKTLRQSQDSEQRVLLQRLEQQEKLLQALKTEKKGLLEKGSKKEDNMKSLQDRVSDLERQTRATLDHLEMLPEKSNLLEQFKDLEESQQQKEAAHNNYSKSKDVVRDLQQQLEESKRKMDEYKDQKMDATSLSLRLSALSSSIKSTSSFLSSTLRSDSH